MHYFIWLRFVLKTYFPLVFKFHFFFLRSFVTGNCGRCCLRGAPVMDEKFILTSISLSFRRRTGAWQNIFTELPTEHKIKPLSTDLKKILFVQVPHQVTPHRDGFGQSSSQKFPYYFFSPLNLVLTDDAFWLQLRAGWCSRADSFVKMCWGGAKTLPYALSHHFRLFDKNCRGTEHAPRGRRMMSTQGLPHCGGKKIITQTSQCVSGAERRGGGADKRRGLCKNVWVCTGKISLPPSHSDCGTDSYEAMASIFRFQLQWKRWSHCSFLSPTDR